MVSFSCDSCQDVVTKPKVVRHLQRCRGGRVSCLDCQRSFDLRTVGGHTSCISEAEKYGDRAAQAKRSKETFCETCELELNGAVHALQHYESKKHRAALRRAKQQQQQQQQYQKQQDNQGKERIDQESDTTCSKIQSKLASKNEVSGNWDDTPLKIGVRVKKAMKSALRQTSRKRMKTDTLVKALRIYFGDSAPGNLQAIVERKAHKCRHFEIQRHRILLKSAADKEGTSTTISKVHSNVFR